MKKINIFNIVMATLVIIADILFILEGGLITKTIASLLFVVIGFINLIYLLNIKKEKSLSAYLLFLGLCFACLGDILLEIQFIVGGILFGIGHIFYFISYCKIVQFKWKDLIFGLVIFSVGLCVILFLPIFNHLDVATKILCSAYALVISFMVGKATSNLLREKSTLNIIILIASILFFISDLVLLFNVFGKSSFVLRVICLISYYPSEYLLAFSILRMKKS